jgi:GxxExxY protein
LDVSGWLDINTRDNHKGHKGHEVKRKDLCALDVLCGKTGINMPKYAPIPKETERWGKALLDACFEVHTQLGPGFLERIYEDALCHELTLRQIPFERQKAIAVPCKTFRIEGQRLDLLIAGQVIAELKAVEIIHPLHQAQLISYLKASGLRLGYLLNFNVSHFKDGICRMIL